MSEFEGKVVLVTGAASGFGRLLAQRLAPTGAKLVLGDLNTEGLQATLDSLPVEYRNDVATQTCDVTCEAQVQTLCALADQRFGGLDIAINNAGGSTPMKPLTETTEDEFDFNYQLNAKSVFFGMKHQIPLLLKRGGGSILNVSSMAGVNGAPKLTAYAAAKHAVVGMSKTAAAEYGRQNVRVNAICPFFSPTPLVTEGMDPAVMEMVAAAAPLKRLGDPEEIVSAMLSLVSPSNSYMTGQAVCVDGGISAL